MTNVRTVPSEPASQSDDLLTHMPQAEFVAAWETLVGEPPAMMLDSRSEMIRVLVESMPVEPLTGPAASITAEGSGSTPGACG